jgi:hypothetical protein
MITSNHNILLWPSFFYIFKKMRDSINSWHDARWYVVSFIYLMSRCL